MLLQELFQKEDTQKTSIYDHLEPYKSNPNIFFKFSKNINSSINQVHDDLPNGVYAYNLKQSWNIINDQKSLKALPPSLNHPYVSIFEYHPKHILDAIKYKNFDGDYKILYGKYSDMINLPDLLKKLPQNESDYILLYNLTKFIAQEIHPQQYQEHWNQIIRSLGYDTIQDLNNKNYQIIILNHNIIHPIDTLLNQDYKHSTNNVDINSPKELLNHIQYNSNTNVKTILNSIPHNLIEFLQQYLENKNNDQTLFNFLYDNRNIQDIKLLLLIWLNNHINIHHISNNLITHMKEILLDKPINDIIKYAHNMVKNNVWNDDILKHNLALLKAK